MFLAGVCAKGHERYVRKAMGSMLEMRWVLIASSKNLATSIFKKFHNIDNDLLRAQICVIRLWSEFEFIYSYNFSWAPSSINFAFPFPLPKKIKQSSYQRQFASRANMYDESWSEFRFVSVRRFLDIKFAYKLSFQVFKIILSFSPTIRCFKANCGWYLDAAVSALRTLDRKIFRSKCKFFNEQAESTYFRQFAKKANILFYSKLNLRRNSGRPNERTHVTVWCQIARTLDKNQNLLRFCFKKKAFCGLYPRSESTGYKICWRACRRYGGFLIEKKRFHRRQSGKRKSKRRTPTERGGNACGEN